MEAPRELKRKASGEEMDPRAEQLLALLLNMPDEQLEQLAQVPPDQFAQMLAEEGLSPDDIEMIMEMLMTSGILGQGQPGEQGPPIQGPPQGGMMPPQGMPPGGMPPQGGGPMPNMGGM